MLDFLLNVTLLNVIGPSAYYEAKPLAIYGGDSEDIPKASDVLCGTNILQEVSYLL